MFDSDLLIGIYIQQQKKRENLLLLNLLKNKICYIQEIYITCKTNCILSIQLVLHVIYISGIQHILFSINSKVTSVRVSLAVGYIVQKNIVQKKLLPDRRMPVDKENNT